MLRLNLEPGVVLSVTFASVYVRVCCVVILLVMYAFVIPVTLKSWTMYALDRYTIFFIDAKMLYVEERNMLEGIVYMFILLFILFQMDMAIHGHTETIMNLRYLRLDPSTHYYRTYLWWKGRDFDPLISLDFNHNLFLQQVFF